MAIEAFCTKTLEKVDPGKHDEKWKVSECDVNTKYQKPSFPKMENRPSKGRRFGKNEGLQSNSVFKNP